MIFDDLINDIDRGREGLNHGIPMGLPKLEGIIDGVTKETYTLIISSSGSGKTSLALYSFVYRPLMEHLEDEDFKVLYFSLEMSQKALYIKLLSTYIFEKYGIKLSFKQILSREKSYILSDEHYKLILEQRDWIEKISQRLEIVDKHVNANKVYAILKNRLEKLGEFKETETRTIYIPHNPNLTYVVVTDHIGLVKPSDGRTLKQEIDLLSAYLVTLRDKCGISPVVIQQANRDQGNIERFKANKTAFTMNDAKDSGNTVNDCNIMLALYAPHKDGLKTYRKYDISLLDSRFRSCQVIKNRYGDCDIEVGLNFFGEINMFAELPKSDKIYDYEKYKTPFWILDKDLDKEDTVQIEKTDEQTSKISKFVL